MNKVIQFLNFRFSVSFFHVAEILLFVILLSVTQSFFVSLIISAVITYIWEVKFADKDRDTIEVWYKNGG